MKPEKIFKRSCITLLIVFITTLAIAVVMGNTQKSDEIELPTIFVMILVFSGLLLMLCFAAMFVMRLIRDIKGGNKRRVMVMLPQTAVLTVVSYIADRFIFKGDNSLLESFFIALTIVVISYASNYIFRKNKE